MKPGDIYRCPQCRGPLRSDTRAYRCTSCARNYPIVLGIPDFRLTPDPYISFASEYEKARRLEEAGKTRSFEALVRHYWEITPDVPRAAVERYVRYTLGGTQRGHEFLRHIDEHLGQQWTGETFMEIGCGTGGLLLEARRRFALLVGTDIALRWLIIARKRLVEAGQPVALACCSAERLPFPDRVFDGVVGQHVLEHMQNPQAALLETARTLKPEGVCAFATPNRFSLGPEPCVRVWGVGFLPRRLAGPYVRLVKGIPYRHIRLLSWFDLRRLLARSGFRRWHIAPSRIMECEQQAVSSAARKLIRVYHALLALPVFSLLSCVFGPSLQVVGRK